MTYYQDTSYYVQKNGLITPLTHFSIKSASNGKRLHFPFFACRGSPQSPENLRLRLRSYAPLRGAKCMKDFHKTKKAGRSTKPESDEMPQYITRRFRPFSYSFVSAYPVPLPEFQGTDQHYILPFANLSYLLLLSDT